MSQYANAFESEPAAAKANQSLHTLRPGLTPGLYADFARDWVAAGARVIGGCCGVGPEHIEAVAALRASLAAGDNKLQVLHAGAKLGGAGVVAAASVQLEE